MAQMSAYLHFNGNCREAMAFYKACLGGELALQAVGETPMADQMPPELHKNILHASLTNDGFVLLGSDMIGAEGVVKGNVISLCLNCGSQEEIQTCFARLASGGEIGHALEEAFWGATFGELTDKYGINWMFTYDKNSQA
jgi:PhnB protein